MHTHSHVHSYPCRARTHNRKHTRLHTHAALAHAHECTGTDHVPLVSLVLWVLLVRARTQGRVATLRYHEGEDVNEAAAAFVRCAIRHLW